jgi:hypothetical protein
MPEFFGRAQGAPLCSKAKNHHRKNLMRMTSNLSACSWPKNLLFFTGWVAAETGLTLNCGAFAMCVRREGIRKALWELTKRVCKSRESKRPELGELPLKSAWH